MLLSNGAEAVIVDFNPQHPVQPKVQYLGNLTGSFLSETSLKEIDLAENLEIEIVPPVGSMFARF